MSNRTFVSLACAAAFACAIPGCDDNSYIDYENAQSACERYTTCGSCTPIMGCGWCSTPDGQGLCAADPDQCENVSAFNWTWDPKGCFETGHAAAPGVTPPDAGKAPTPVDAGAPALDAGPAPVDAAPPAADAALH